MTGWQVQDLCDNCVDRLRSLLVEQGINVAKVDEVVEEEVEPEMPEDIESEAVAPAEMRRLGGPRALTHSGHCDTQPRRLL